VRTERYRFTEWPDGSREMYDLQTDPDEATNLARDPRQSAALQDMKKLLDAGPAAAQRGLKASADGGR
jgi:arylsulfatase A-like enzyme